jgi:hypothetical protein
MTPADAVDSPARDRLLAALRAGRFDEAEVVLAEAGTPSTRRSFSTCRDADAPRQWPQAAWLFSRSRPPPSTPPPR